MGAAEAKRNLDKSAQGDGKRERAPADGVRASDKPMEPADLDRKRERAPAKGVMDSDDPAHLLDSSCGGGNMAALGKGQGGRERAPASGAKGSGDPSTSEEAQASKA